MTHMIPFHMVLGPYYGVPSNGQLIWVICHQIGMNHRLNHAKVDKDLRLRGGNFENLRIKALKSEIVNWNKNMQFVSNDCTAETKRFRHTRFEWSLNHLLFEVYFLSGPQKGRFSCYLCHITYVHLVTFTTVSCCQLDILWNGSHLVWMTERLASSTTSTNSTGHDGRRSTGSFLIRTVLQEPQLTSAIYLMWRRFGLSIQ